MSRWLTIEAERVLYVERGRDVILCDRGHSGSVTLVIKVSDTESEQTMSHDGPSMEGFELLQRISNSYARGVALPKRDPIADSLAKDHFIICRRSDNDTETWWITDKGREWLKAS